MDEEGRKTQKTDVVAWVITFWPIIVFIGGGVGTLWMGIQSVSAQITRMNDKIEYESKLSSERMDELKRRVGSLETRIETVSDVRQKDRKNEP